MYLAFSTFAKNKEIFWKKNSFLRIMTKITRLQAIEAQISFIDEFVHTFDCETLVGLNFTRFKLTFLFYAPTGLAVISFTYLQVQLSLLNELISQLITPSAVFCSKLKFPWRFTSPCPPKMQAIENLWVPWDRQPKNMIMKVYTHLGECGEQVGLERVVINQVINGNYYSVTIT